MDTPEPEIIKNTAPSPLARIYKSKKFLRAWRRFLRRRKRVMGAQLTSATAPAK